MTHNSKPVVSVILPIYKEPVAYIRQSIDSILNQTFSNFELIAIFDTGTNDPYFETLYREIVEYYSSESRIKFAFNEENIGLPLTLNKAIDMTKGKYIARMDADDIALPHRIERQLYFIEKNPHIDLCGARVYYMNHEGRPMGISKALTQCEIIKRLYSGITPLCHPTWFSKREFLLNMKYKNLAPIEDYELLCRGLLNGKLYGIVNEPLLNYRIWSISSKISSEKRVIQVITAIHISSKTQRLLEFNYEDYKNITEKTNNNIWKLIIKLDKLSRYVEHKLGSYLPTRIFNIFKWIFFAISPAKALQIMHIILSYRRYKKDINFIEFIRNKLNLDCKV